MSDCDDEWRVLSTVEGRALFDSVEKTPQPGPSDLDRWRRASNPELVRAAMRIAEARRKARGKFSEAERLWLDARGVEQATHEVVATYKSRRFAEFCAVLDLCSGSGGDAMAMARTGRSVIAVESDSCRCRRLVWNARQVGLEDRVLVVQGDARNAPVGRNLPAHIDPDRRARLDGRRARRLDEYEPDLNWLRSWMLASRSPGVAVKLSPASDFEAAFPGHNLEIEIISLHGECKEATVWSGGLATCRRRATILPEGATFACDEIVERGVGSGPIEGWIHDPDPALVRAGLLDEFARRHELRRVAPKVAYLASSSRLESPFVAAFRVVDVLPMDLKRIRREARRRGLGPLEIKVRGVSVKPEELREQVGRYGDSPATLLIFRDERATRVVLAERVAGETT